VHDETGQRASEKKAQIERELFLNAFSPSPPSPELSRRLANVLRDVYAKAGDIIFERGEQPKTAHFIVSGELAMFGEDDEEPIVFGPGSIVGMLDLNIGRRRARTARVTSDCHLLELPYAQWLELTEDHPEYTTSTRRRVSEGLHELMLNFTTQQILVFERSARAPFLDAAMIYRIAALRSPVVFEQARVDTLVELAKRASLLRVERGQLIAPPGSNSDKLFVVMQGALEVQRRVSPELTGTFGPGQLVLGGAALSGALRNYAVTAATYSVVLVLEHRDLDDIAEEKFDLVLSCLRGLSIERDALLGRRARRSVLPPSAPAPSLPVPPSLAAAQRESSDVELKGPEPGQSA
jgi:CRP-like cAMP-binding protein